MQSIFITQLSHQTNICIKFYRAIIIWLHSHTNQTHSNHHYIYIYIYIYIYSEIDLQQLDHNKYIVWYCFIKILLGIKNTIYHATRYISTVVVVVAIYMRLPRMKHDIQGLNSNDENNYLVLQAIHFLYFTFLYPHLYSCVTFLNYVFHIKKTSFPLIAIMTHTHIIITWGVVDDTC